MRLPESLDSYYYQQGYNYIDTVPNSETKLGGGCQASSLLIGLRLMSGNPNLTMGDVSAKAIEEGLIFYDLGCADRISYASIPVISSSMLVGHNVRLSIETPLEKITEESTNEFGREANRIYLNIPKRENLSAVYGVDKSHQVENMLEVLSNDGIAIPLVHPNTLHESTNPDTQGFLHAIVLTGYNKNNQTVSVIDPNPGFSSVPNFAIRKNEGRLKIPSNRIHSIEMANRVANKYHPQGSVVYDVSVNLLENALRGVSTTILN